MGAAGFRSARAGFGWVRLDSGRCGWVRVDCPFSSYAFSVGKDKNQKYMKSCLDLIISCILCFAHQYHCCFSTIFKHSSLSEAAMFRMNVFARSHLTQPSTLSPAFTSSLIQSQKCTSDDCRSLSQRQFYYKTRVFNR